MQSHHPTLDALTDYASGGLKLSHSMCIATHIEFCRECRLQVKKLEQIGAEVFFTQDTSCNTSEHTEEIKEAVFDKIFIKKSDSQNNIPQDMNAGQANPLHKFSSQGVPRSLKQFVPNDFDSLQWNYLTPSIQLCTLCKDRDGVQIAISRVKPGGKLPHHSHTGKEITVVLKGSFSDENGIYSKGDFISRDAKDKHKPVVTKDAECICLMVLDSPIEFTGFITRLLNPLIRKSHYKH